MIGRRLFVVRLLAAILLAPMGLRLLEDRSLSGNGQVPCWDCGQVPTDDKGRRAVGLGFNCPACFDRDTLAYLRRPATNPRWNTSMPASQSPRRRSGRRTDLSPSGYC